MSKKDLLISLLVVIIMLLIGLLYNVSARKHMVFRLWDEWHQVVLWI